MEFTQFISYLDYGVLGLSAIILILSFVLLSREQKREIFRPEVASAIRKYMMLALAFAGVGLVSTIVDGVMVQPAKEEQKLQEERTALLSQMIAKVADNVGKENNKEAEIPVKTEEVELNIETPEESKSNKPEPKPKPNADIGGEDTSSIVVPEPDEGTNVDSLATSDKDPQVKKEEEAILGLIEEFGLIKDKTLGKGVVDSLKEINIPAANIIEQRLLSAEE